MLLIFVVTMLKNHHKKRENILKSKFVIIEKG